MRRILLLPFIVAFVFYFNSCAPSNNKIKNGIKLDEKGLHVEEAYLTNNEQSTISNDNKVKVGERVCLRLVIDGWKERDGKVFFDAAQRTSNSTGVVLAANPSMFGAVYGGGAMPESAKYVLLYQTIGKLDNPNDYIVITFKIRDKITNKSVSGSYKLYI